MGALYTRTLRTILFTCLTVLSNWCMAQCPNVYDFYGQVNDDPYWYSCSGNNFAFNLSTPSTWGAFSIDWGDGSPLTTGASWAPPTFQSHLYAAAVDTFVVTISEVNTGCVVTGVVVMEEATSASIQIPVGGLTQACAPQMMEFINSSTNVSQTTVFTWDFGDGSPLLTFDYTNWNQVIQHTYEIGTVTCETEVSLTAQNYCNVVQGGNSEATFNPIRIWDLDDPAITASATLLCYPDTTVTFMNTTYRNCLFQGNIYQRYEYWNFGDYWNLGHDSIIDWTPWPPTFPHTMHYPGIGTYTVELLDSNYCGVAPTSITIQIVPPPVAGIAASEDTVCVGEPITFYQQATGGANFYQWNFGNNWITTGSGNITRIFNNPGTYLVANMVGISGATDGCTDTAWVQVVVLPKPTVQILADQTEGCDAFDVNFDANIANAQSYLWQFDVAPNVYSGMDPPLILYNTPGDHLVTLTVTGINGCSDDDDITIHVNLSPVVDFDYYNLCELDTAWFTDMSYASVNDSIVSWSWDFGDGGSSSEQNPSHLFPAVGSYDITLNVQTPNCVNSDSSTVVIEARPTTSASADVYSGCSPLQVQFSQSSTGATQYFWNMPDGAIINAGNTSYTFINNGGSDTTLMVVLRAENDFGCGSYDTLMIEVLHNAHAGFIDNLNPPGCSPYIASFINTSSFADSYAWDFDDGTTSNLEDANHLFNNTSGFVVSYDIQLVAFNSNGCNDTISHPIIVYPLLNLDFDLTGDSGCSPLTVALPFVPGVQQYTWDFGDGTGSTAIIPQHTFVNTTTDAVDYVITLTGVSPFGCVDTASSNITIFHTPIAQFSLDQSIGCSPLTTELMNSSIGADLYAWNFGDGNLLDSSFLSIQHTYNNSTTLSQNYLLTLNASTSDGCSDSYSQSVTVHPSVVAAFADPSEFCSPAAVTLQNQSVNASGYLWDLGNGTQSVAYQPNVTYINQDGVSDSLLITLVAFSAQGCIDTVQHDVFIHPTPELIFTLDAISSCTPMNVNITNNSLYTDQIEWSFGDGITANSIDSVLTHSYVNTGSTLLAYTLTAMASNAAGCFDSGQQTIQVFPMPSANFVVPGPQCSPATISLLNGSTNASLVEWISNGTSQQGGSYNINLINNSDTVLIHPISLVATSPYGCQDTLTQNLVVYPKPYAAFDLDTNVFCGNGQVAIHNWSLYADQMLWYYGDGQSSNVTDSIHFYDYINNNSATADFDMQLQVTNEYGCSDAALQEVIVYPFVTAFFAAPSPQCSPAEITVVSGSQNASYLNWQLASGLSGGNTSITANYINESDTLINDMITLIATSAYGCSDTLSHAIAVYPKPNASFAMSLDEICYSSVVTINNTSLHASAFAWNYGDGNTADITDSTHTHVYTNTTNSVQAFDLILVASNAWGCSDQAENDVTVYPEVNAQIPTINSECSPSTFVLQSITQPSNSVAWYVGDLIFNDELINLSYVNVSDTLLNIDVTLISTSVYGCSDTATQVISTLPKPMADFEMSDVLVCEAGAVTLTNTSAFATAYSWSYGDGQNSTTSLQEHEHEYTSEGAYVGQYSIGLTASNIYGCSDFTSSNYQIYPPVVAAFAGDTTGCAPHGVTWMNTSEGAVSYQWELGNGQESSMETPYALYDGNNSVDTTYTATLVATSIYGCESQVSLPVHVYHTPIALASVDTTQGCFPTQVTLHNASIGASIYQWAYGNGFTSDTTAMYHQVPFYNYTNNPLTYPIQLIASTEMGCQDVTTTSVTIGPQLIASFVMPLEDCSPFATYIDNTSIGGNVYNWNFGDGETSNVYEPNHTFFNWGMSDTTYTVELVISDNFGCTDTAITTVAVYPIPVASFMVSPSQQVWPNATVVLDNTTMAGSINSSWSMGNSTNLYTNEPGSFSYTSWGEYTIQLVVSNGSCSDTTYQSIEILPPLPVAAFEGPAEGCVPLTVQFDNLSENHVYSSWSFGDGGSSNTTDPSYTYYQPGTYTVSLIVTGPGGETDQMVQEQIIVVHPRAQAAFTITPTEVNVPGEPIYCLNLSSGASGYSWDFGDGTNSTAENPLHEYQEEGVYSIQLIAENSFGCPDTMLLVDVVRAIVGGMIDFPNAFTPSTTGSNGGYYDANSMDNDYFFPMNAGVVDYHLMIFNKWGELLFESKDVKRGWDGYYRGELCRQDVYVWKVNATFANGESTTQSGDVTLIVK
jgi:PKD repeat protein